MRLAGTPLAGWNNACDVGRIMSMRHLEVKLYQLNAALHWPS